MSDVPAPSVGVLDPEVPTLDPLPSSLSHGDVDVALVRWPAEASMRDALAALGRPRLLLVEPGASPPDTVDQAEDWLRWPPDPGDLLLRAQTLSRRAADAAPPLPLDLDEHGVLHRGDRWVAISETQVPILRLLLESLDRVVRLETITEAYVQGGGSGHPASVRTALSRLEARVRPLGLHLRSVRRRGVVLRAGGR